MEKILNVGMCIQFGGTEAELEDLKRILDHHVDYMISTSEFPEIKRISVVTVEEENNNEKRAHL